MDKFSKLVSYVDLQMWAFEKDPADTKYQEGWLNALLDIKNYMSYLENVNEKD